MRSTLMLYRGSTELYRGAPSRCQVRRRTAGWGRAPGHAKAEKPKKPKTAVLSSQVKKGGWLSEPVRPVQSTPRTRQPVRSQTRCACLGVQTGGPACRPAACMQRHAPCTPRSAPAGAAEAGQRPPTRNSRQFDAHVPHVCVRRARERARRPRQTPGQCCARPARPPGWRRRQQAARWQPAPATGGPRPM